MALAGVPQQVEFRGRVFLSRLGVAQALGRSVRTIQRLEKRGVLRPLRDLNGRQGERWFPENEIEALARIAEEVGYVDAPNANFDAFCEAVAEWRKLTRTEIKPHLDCPQQEPIYRLRRNLRQYEEEEGDWQPEQRAPALVRACSQCGGGVRIVTDQFQRQAAVCPLHGRIKAVMVSPPAQDGTKWGHDYSVPSLSEDEPPRLQRSRSLSQADVAAAIRAPRAQPKAAVSFLDPPPQSTRPS